MLDGVLHEIEIRIHRENQFLPEEILDLRRKLIVNQVGIREQNDRSFLGGFFQMRTAAGRLIR